jgi:CubicO group peptidase (beta-lactamase class C family)
MLDEFARRNIFAPLGMRDTGFNPDAKLRTRIAPTEKRRGQMNYLGDSGADAGSEGDQWLRGQVHDPTSFRMNGVAGHAGLFSTADDLAIFCQMLLSGGVYNGTRILSPMTIGAMTQPHAVSETGAARGLGWDIASSFSSNKGDLFPLGSFGHTGFTGTSIWIDPASDSFLIFLSNRVHPDGKGDVGALPRTRGLDRREFDGRRLRRQGAPVSRKYGSGTTHQPGAAQQPHHLDNRCTCRRSSADRNRRART